MRLPAPVAALVLLIGATAVAGAQQPDALSTIRDSVLSGVVLDIRGRPVDSAQVVLTELRRVYRTMPDGSFWFDSVPPGTYELTFRKLGYMAQAWDVTVRPGGTALVLQVQPNIPVMEPIIARASRGGVGGVVMDTAKRLLQGAEIRLNGGRLARTDERGQFFIGAPPGRYLLHIRHRGHATQFVSVVVPRDSGAQIAAWLTPTPRGYAGREAFVLDSFRTRMLHRNPVWSRLFTRDDIVRNGFTRLDQIAIVGAGHGLPALVASPDGECMANVDGLHKQPLWSLDAADIEFVEVYTTKPARSNPGNLRTGPQPPGAPRIGGCPRVYVWLRK